VNPQESGECDATPTIAGILRSDADFYTQKAADYAPDKANPFENVEFAAKFSSGVSGGTGQFSTPEMVLINLIGVKISRLMTVGWGGRNKNEPFVDTLRDLRIYSAMLECYLRSYCDEFKKPKLV